MFKPFLYLHNHWLPHIELAKPTLIELVESDKQFVLIPFVSGNYFRTAFDPTAQRNL